MPAELKLIPLSREECANILQQRGQLPPHNEVDNSPPSQSALEEFNRKRYPITLKLCANTTEVIELDDDIDIEPEVVKYASKFQDGSVAAIVSLGRNFSTGIKHTVVSRALCDVSLTKSSTVGKKKEVIVDLATSPDMNASAATPSSSSPGAKLGENMQSTPADEDDNANTAAVASLGMRKPPGKHAVYLDGKHVNQPLGREVPLTNESIIALYTVTGFAYQVQIIQDKNDGAEEEEKEAASVISSPKKRKANPPTPKKQSPIRPKQPTVRQQIRHRAHKLMVGECTCALCMDILIKATFAYPCGHAFCEGCSQGVTNAAASANAATNTRGALKKKGTCPTCRGSVEGWMQARSFDTVVWSTALQGCFERSDAEYYLERRQEAGEDAPTEEERGSILNIDKGEYGQSNNNSMMGGSMMNGLVSHNPSMQPSSNVAMRTLPPENPLQMVANANNGNHVGLSMRQQNRGTKSGDNEVICID